MTTAVELAHIAGEARRTRRNLSRARVDVGLADYEVRRWDAWHRHITLALVAHAALEIGASRHRHSV